MAFSRRPKKRAEKVETTIWSCTSEDCNGWMRESFSFKEEPTCPFCKSPMKQEVRMLPELD